MKTKKRTDKYQATTDKLLQLLNEGVKPWVKPWSCTPYMNLVTKHIYTGCNPILLTIDTMLNDWQKPFFVTFKQAKDNNWKVKKGSKAANILYANTYQKTVENDDGKEESQTRFTYKWFAVFNIACIDDTDAETKIEDAIALLPQHTQFNNETKIQLAENLIAKQEADVSFGGDRACYVPKLDKIRMPEFKSFSSAKKYYATYFHELAHRTGHESRLNRDLSGNFGSKSYAFEELVAELSLRSCT